MRVAVGAGGRSVKHPAATDRNHRRHGVKHPKRRNTLAKGKRTQELYFDRPARRLDGSPGILIERASVTLHDGCVGRSAQTAGWCWVNYKKPAWVNCSAIPKTLSVR